MEMTETPLADHGRLIALATDGDGTSVSQGRMDAETSAALDRWRRSGRKLLLVTGEPSSQLEFFPELEGFDLVVAENGAVLYEPRRHEHVTLAGAPPGKFLDELGQAQIHPLR